MVSVVPQVMDSILTVGHGCCYLGQPCVRVEARKGQGARCELVTEEPAVDLLYETVPASDAAAHARRYSGYHERSATQCQLLCLDQDEA